MAPFSPHIFLFIHNNVFLAIRPRSPARNAHHATISSPIRPAYHAPPRPLHTSPTSYPPAYLTPQPSSKRGGCSHEATEASAAAISAACDTVPTCNHLRHPHTAPRPASQSRSSTGNPWPCRRPSLACRTSRRRIPAVTSSRHGPRAAPVCLRRSRSRRFTIARSASALSLPRQLGQRHPPSDPVAQHLSRAHDPLAWRWHLTRAYVSISSFPASPSQDPHPTDEDREVVGRPSKPRPRKENPKYTGSEWAN